MNWRWGASSACCVAALAVLAGCNSGDACGRTGSKALAPGESAQVSVKRVGNVWEPIDATGHRWEYQAVAPNDVPNGTYEATVTLSETGEQLIVVLPGKDPVTLSAHGCS